MRFRARGLVIIDSEGEFDFPQFQTYSDAKKVADMLNILSGGENGRK